MLKLLGFIILIWSMWRANDSGSNGAYLIKSRPIVMLMIWMQTAVTGRQMYVPSHVIGASDPPGKQTESKIACGCVVAYAVLPQR